MFGVFSYDQMTVGAQWSALWYRGADLVCYETLPWNGGTGGFGYTECGAPLGGWLAGTYEVRLFLGTMWKQSGEFTITGNPPPPTVTSTPTRTPVPSRDHRPSPTPSPTNTLTPSLTYTPSLTPTITRTPPSYQHAPPRPTRACLPPPIRL